MCSLYFSKTSELADRFIDVSLDFIEYRIQHAKQYRKFTMISLLMKSVYADDVIDGLPLSKFWRLYCFKEISSESKIHVKLCYM